MFFRSLKIWNLQSNIVITKREIFFFQSKVQKRLIVTKAREEPPESFEPPTGWLDKSFVWEKPKVFTM